MDSHMDGHMGSHMGSHPGTFHVQGTNFSNRHNGYRGKQHPSPANNMTHLGHGMTNGTGHSGGSSSGDSSEGVGRRAPAFQARVFHGDQEMKVCHAEHVLAKSDASLHSFGRPSMTAFSVLGICFHFRAGNGCSEAPSLTPFCNSC